MTGRGIGLPCRPVGTTRSPRILGDRYSAYSLSLSLSNYTAVSGRDVIRADRRDDEYLNGRGARRGGQAPIRGTINYILLMRMRTHAPIDHTPSRHGPALNRRGA